MVRDQALALSGLLEPKDERPLGLSAAAGRPVAGRLQRPRPRWTTSTGEDRYRRGLYTFWRRTIPYPSMTTFDAPSREVCSVRRIRTNTPLQAFVTLNDPVYVEAAQALARRIVHEGGASPEERCRYALRLCLATPPQATAGRRADLALVGRAEALSRGSPGGPCPGDRAFGQSSAGPRRDRSWRPGPSSPMCYLNLDGVLTKG